MVYEGVVIVSQHEAQRVWADGAGDNELSVVSCMHQAENCSSAMSPPPAASADLEEPSVYKANLEPKVPLWYWIAGSVSAGCARFGLLL